MKKVLILLLPLFILTGCLHFEQTITLKSGGGMTVSMTYSIPEAQVPALAAGHQAIAGWQKLPGGGANWFMDEKAVRGYFEQPRDGLKVLIYKQYRRDGRQLAEIVVEAKDAAAAFEAGYFGNIRMEGRSLTVHFPERLDDLPAEDIARLRQLCGDLAIDLAVITPKAVRETNGFKRGEHQAAWHLSSTGRGIDIFGKLSDLTVNW